MSDSNLYRRQFLARCISTMATGALLPLMFDCSLAAAGEPAASGKVPLVTGTGKDYGKLVAAAIERLGGMKAYVKPGQKVVVKPNIGWDRSVEQGANTHPAVVAALVALALEAGAKEVQVFDRCCNDKVKSYRNSGVQAAIDDLKDDRARCLHIDERRWLPVDLAQGKLVQRWDFYRDAVEADVYINVPVAKHHGSTGLTLGLKNVMGIIGGNRGQIHKQDIHQKIADLNLVRKPTLTVIDASRILTAHGPQGGSLSDVTWLDRIIVSADPVAADAYATTLFGKKPGDIAYIGAAAAHNLGVADLDRIDVIKLG